jgi:hypothetical protein
VTVTVNLSGLEKMVSTSEQTNRLELVSMRAALGMRKYVPQDESTLRSSEPSNSKYKQGLLIWNTPYAAAQYYVAMNHTTAGTTDHWDEHFMRDYGDDLTDYAQSLFKGE